MRLPTIFILIGAVIAAWTAADLVQYGMPDPPFKNFFRILIFGWVLLIGGIAWEFRLWRRQELGLPQGDGILDDPALFPQTPEEKAQTSAQAVEDARRREHEQTLKRLRKGPKVPPGKIDYTAPYASNMKPANLLVSLTRFAMYLPNYQQLVEEVCLARTGGSPSQEERDRLASERHRIERDLAASRDYRLAARRLAQAGVTSELGDQGDYCGDFVVLRFRAYREALAALEELAAEDAGIAPGPARAVAACKFRKFMLKNYSRNHIYQRENLLDVGGSPYHPPGQWKDT